MKYISIFFLFIAYACCTVTAQSKVTISGFVQDKNTGEKLINANVFESASKRGTSTNQYGFYSLSFNTGDSIHLVVSFVGYKPYKIKRVLQANCNYTVLLDEETEIEEVVVSGKNTETIDNRNEMGVLRLPMKQLENLPALSGEVDIMKAFQFMPGIQAVEAKSEINVRGGSPDQNLYLLDEVPLYYVGHFGDFISVFNADAINDVKLIKGGFPARYGSRLSSVIDIRMKDGNMYKYKATGSVGLLSSRIFVEGPIQKEKTTFIVSARKNTLPIFKMIFGMGVGYQFYDANVKITHKFSDTDRAYLSFYMGDDVVSVKSKEKDKDNYFKNTSSVKWGNIALAYRWNHVYNSKFFSNLTLWYSKYRYSNYFNENIKTDSIHQEISNEFIANIQDFAVKFDFEGNLTPKLKIKTGVNSIYHVFMPGQTHYYQTGNKIDKLDTLYNDNSTPAIENALYTESEFKIGNYLDVNMGIRGSHYNYKQQNYLSIEPRLLLNLTLSDNTSLKASYASMKQYVHLLSYSGTGMPSDFWVPATDKNQPEESTQISVGTAHSFKNNMFELSIEAYTKKMDHLIAFKEGESFFGNVESWENKVTKAGIGGSYGIELFLQKLVGNTTGWLSFTYSKADRQFADLNKGESFPFKYDRRYNVGVVVVHQFSPKITASMTWNYGSGYPMTIPNEKYYLDGKDVYAYGAINSFRMRDYHRMDIAVNFTKPLKRCVRVWNISLFNVYNRKNPYYYYFQRERNYEVIKTNHGTGVVSRPGRLILYQQSLMPFFPSISYSLKF